MGRTFSNYPWWLCEFPKGREYLAKKFGPENQGKKPKPKKPKKPKKMRFFVRLFRWLVKDRWEVRALGFPYSPGYTIYNPWRKTMLDTTLDIDQAEQWAKEQNGHHSNNT